MKILMISDVYFPRINGVSSSIETFRRELQARGDQVCVIAPRYGNADPRDDVIRIAARGVPFDPEDRLMSRSLILAQASRLRECQFDLVHIHTPFVAHYAGIALARSLGVACIATYHTFFEEYLHHYVPFLPARTTRALARRISRGQCNQLDAVIVPSRPLRDVLRGYGVRAPLHVLPTGIPLQRFAAGDGAAFRLRHGIGAGRLVALYVGRVAFEKNIDFLLDAADRVRRDLPEFLLAITGEGPSLESLRARAGRLGLDRHVMFMGYLDRHTQLADCYAAANVFAFASRTETQGLVLLEAMAMGLPVVAVAELGTRDILDAGRGCLVAAADVDDFAAQLERVLRDAPLRRRLGAEAKVYAAGWDAGIMAGKLREIYSAIRAQRTPARGATAPPVPHARESSAKRH